MEPSAALMTVALGARWLKIQTRLVHGSNIMPSGPPSTSMVLMGAIVFESHMATGLLLANPWLDLGSTAAPRALVLAISPADASVSRLKTVTRAPSPVRGM